MSHYPYRAAALPRDTVSGVMTDRARVCALVFAAALLGAVMQPARGCQIAEKPPFRELVAAATSVAIVEVTAQRAETQMIGDGEYEFVVADLRVVETLVGDRPGVRRVRYQSHWCGGHSLNIGRFYVVVLSGNEETLKIGAGSQALLGLGDEYEEGEGSDSSRSTLLMQLRNFKHIGQVPEGFDAQPFLAIVQPHLEWPSVEKRR